MAQDVLTVAVSSKQYYTHGTAIVACDKLGNVSTLAPVVTVTTSSGSITAIASGLNGRLDQRTWYTA